MLADVLQPAVSGDVKSHLVTSIRRAGPVLLSGSGPALVCGNRPGRQGSRRRPGRAVHIASGTQAATKVATSAIATAIRDGVSARRRCRITGLTTASA